MTTSTKGVFLDSLISVSSLMDLVWKLVIERLRQPHFNRQLGTVMVADFGNEFIVFLKQRNHLLVKRI